jgi:hypothetical protein
MRPIRATYFGAGVLRKKSDTLPMAEKPVFMRFSAWFPPNGAFRGAIGVIDRRYLG